MEATKLTRTYVSPFGSMRMLAGAPALDLANTLHWRDGEAIDFIPSYEDLLRFCIPAQLLAEGEGRALMRLNKNHRDVARDVHAEVLKLRSALKAWLISSARNPSHGTAPKRSSLNDFQEAIARAGGTARLGSILTLTTVSESEAICLPLRRSAAAAAMLVLFPPANDIRQCEADRCGGFFVNESRSKPRRWCSMDGCGNRAKAARFRLAHR